MNKDKIKNIILSRVNNDKAVIPNIRISYSVTAVTVEYRVSDEKPFEGVTRVCYGFGFVLRLICAVIKTKRSLERDLKKEYEKDNWL